MKARSLLLLALLLAAACSDDSTSPLPPDSGSAPDTELLPDAAADADAPDAGASDADMSDADMSDADMSDAEPDVEVLRTIEIEPSLDEFSTHNSVLDPKFSTYNRASNWFALELGLQGPTDFYRRAARHRPTRTPGSTPALRMTPSNSATAIALYGRVLLGQAPREISLWFGRPAGEPYIAPDAIGVQGFSAVQSAYVSSEPLIDTGETFESDGIAWRRWAGTTAGILGYNYLTIRTSITTDAWIAAPTITVRADDPRAITRPLAPPTPLQGRDLEALQAVMAEAERRRDAPQPPKPIVDRSPLDDVTP